MRPVTARFLAALRGSHTIAVRARIVEPGQTGTDPDGTEVEIIAGDVQLDADADVRSTLDITIPGSYWPKRDVSIAAPYGHEVFVERGIRYPDGTTELVALGYHRIDTLEQDDAPKGTIRITGSDRMIGISEGRLVQPIQYQPGTTIGAIVDELVTELYPDAVIEWDDNTDDSEIARALVAEEDRRAFLADLVTAAGKVWWWDQRGVLVIRDLPPAEEAVFQVDNGTLGVLVSMSRQLSRIGAYNGIVVTGEATDTIPPVRAVLGDNYSLSPTRWGGPFGKIPRFYSSPFITTSNQAIAAARSILTGILGVPYAVNFGAIVNPALEPFDPVAIRYDYDRPTENHIIQTLTVPLAADEAMTAKTREQTVINISAVS